MYRLTNTSTIIRISDNASIPMDAGNVDYLAFLEWQASGGVPEPYVEPEPQVPQTVTMRQARLALLGAGLLSGVETAIDALPSPQKEAARIEWEYSQEVQRHNGFVAIIGPSLGLTEQQIDDLFFLAATL